MPIALRRPPKKWVRNASFTWAASRRIKKMSEHLRSRLEVGKTLRSGRVPTIELRASMIIGHGSLSWLIVRDLAARLPFMILPRWLESRTEPVGIDDVSTALLGALTLTLTQRSLFHSGPRGHAMTGKNVLESAPRSYWAGASRRWCRCLFLTPRLSSHWVRFVTRANWDVAKEIVVGLNGDLLAPDRRYWELTGHARRQMFRRGRARSRSPKSVGTLPWKDLGAPSNAGSTRTLKPRRPSAELGRSRNHPPGDLRG